MYSERQRGLPARRPVGGFERPSTPERPRVVIFEPHPVVRVALECLLTREGFRAEAGDETSTVASGPALMLVGDEGGLYVFKSRDAAETLEQFQLDAQFSEALSAVTGIWAFVPKPFGADDLLRVVRTVRGFDGRRKPRSRTV